MAKFEFFDVCSPLKIRYIGAKGAFIKVLRFDAKNGCREVITKEGPFGKTWPSELRRKRSPPSPRHATGFEAREDDF